MSLPRTRQGVLDLDKILGRPKPARIVRGLCTPCKMRPTGRTMRGVKPVLLDDLFGGYEEVRVPCSYEHVECVKCGAEDWCPE